MAISVPKDGRAFIEGIAKTICKECHAEWHWDKHDGPEEVVRIVVRDSNALTFQFDVKTLADQESEEFRQVCLNFLDQCLRTFRPRS